MPHLGVSNGYATSWTPTPFASNPSSSSPTALAVANGSGGGSSKVVVPNGGQQPRRRLQPRSSFHNYSPLASQSYRRLKRHCLKRRQLFVDIAFPPTHASLFLDSTQRRASSSSHGAADSIVWRRPGELVDDPKLFVEGASPNDVTQGILGNCWFVSACSALTHNQRLLDKVIPNASEQEWDTANDYCGIFQFHFWRFGQWIEVVIDDLLPVRDGSLLFARSKTPNEFWSALLEKAFAKLYGCYENLVGGQLADALQDVSGGVAESINVRKYLDFRGCDANYRLFHLLSTAYDQQALIVAAIAAKRDEIEKSLDCGLVKGHAYAVTAVRCIDLDAAGDGSLRAGERQMMVRLQNPWGEKEWNGPWSDGSSEWELVTERQKAALGITVDEDGEFWMPWEAFVRHFTDISVCQLFNTHASHVMSDFGPFQLRRKGGSDYHEYTFYDSWSTNGAKSAAPKDRAGGCQNFAATFCFNPQYTFDISRVRSVSVSNNNNNNNSGKNSPDCAVTGGGEVMIALTQKDHWTAGAKQREPFVTMGIHVMRVENNRRHRIHQAINPVATSDYASTRSVYLHLTDLAAGRYIVMPTTYAPREHTEFLLRIYSSSTLRVRALTNDAPSNGMFRCSNVRSVTRVKITEAVVTRMKDASRCYVVVAANGERARTATSHMGFDKELLLFHSRTMRQKLMFELWEERTLKDRCLGRSLAVTVQTDNDTVRYQLTLHPTLMVAVGAMGIASDGQKASNGNVTGAAKKNVLGKLSVEISSYDDPMYL